MVRERSRLITPPYMGLVDNVTVTTMSKESIGAELAAVTQALAGAVWTANLVVYIPFILKSPCLVAQFMWLNGGVANGNTDVGVYTEDGQTKLGSTGATANAGTDVFQKVNVTDFLLPANQRLWLALGCDSATHEFQRTAVAIAAIDLFGVKQEPSGYSGGLPATATFSTPTVAKTPMFGFTGQSVI